ncbi:hypothetical protein acsn021_19670 [Anaerocolumna cellulosilytica]|uniref:Uncharacterized protein n=1 Tax=Anaerocolumna cellulosilytica TaxID=433286 RepID=A0A6S6R5T1_9FIRM|nr:hypothetical protein [Anaerocolumna cellulosilytica]MBB5196480.1 [acyl-carrier-protein] S-malonyltransferase [Anaerocolumna cellulosilytica]BCJ94398.1 hypothetical protein acsn021_19670 [Anaerocolumna cellulosilytica]
MADYIPTVISECLRIVVCTRNLNWNNDEYKANVIEPYNKIQEMQNELERSNMTATVEQMREVLEMLKLVFKTKKVPLEEQLERFNEVFDKTQTRSLFTDFELPTAEDL